MRRFTDNQGREWPITVNVAAVKRVRTLAGVDLLGLLDPQQQVAEKLADPVTLCDVLFAVVAPEADARGVTSAAFGEAMAGDAIDSATHALMEEVVDFFPNAQRRELGHKVLKAADLYAKMQTDAALKDLADKTPEAIAGALWEKHGPQSGNAPESSD